MWTQVRAERWPDPGETLVGRDFLMLGGGKAANVAWLAQRLGVEAHLAAHVGDDPLAEHAVAPLCARGVDLTLVRQVSGCATGISMIVVRSDGRKTIVLAPNANDVWDQNDKNVVRAAIEDVPSGSMLVADLEIPAFIVTCAVGAARRCGLRVLLDPSPPNRMEEGLLAGCHYL